MGREKKTTEKRKRTHTTGDKLDSKKKKKETVKSDSEKKDKKAVKAKKLKKDKKDKKEKKRKHADEKTAKKIVEEIAEKAREEKKLKKQKKHAEKHSESDITADKSKQRSKAESGKKAEDPKVISVSGLDTSQQAKFLRLMGAGKTKDKIRVSTEPANYDTQVRDLESQFKKGIEHKGEGRVGLGKR